MWLVEPVSSVAEVEVVVRPQIFLYIVFYLQTGVRIKNCHDKNLMCIHVSISKGWVFINFDRAWIIHFQIFQIPNAIDRPIVQWDNYSNNGFACIVHPVRVELQVGLQENHEILNKNVVENDDKICLGWPLYLFWHEHDVIGFFFWAPRDVHCRLRIGGKLAAEGTPSCLKIIGKSVEEEHLKTKVNDKADDHENLNILTTNTQLLEN